MELHSELEGAVWAMASSAYGASVDKELGEALAWFRRRPGFDDTLRLYARTAGPGLRVLAQMLPLHCSSGVYRLHEEFVEILYQLRWHIVRHLQWRLITDGHASPMIRDDFLASDLGPNLCAGDLGAPGSEGRHRLSSAVSRISAACGGSLRSHRVRQLNLTRAFSYLLPHEAMLQAAQFLHHPLVSRMILGKL